MKFYSHSWGIRRNPQIAHILGVDRIYAARPSVFPWRSKKASDVLIGWGHKANTVTARQQAKAQGIPYWALEDGFIASARHPTQTTQRLSLIRDSSGIYYDSRQTNDLEALLDVPQSIGATNGNESAQRRFDRAARVMAQCVKLKVSKYNQIRSPFPSWLTKARQECVDMTLVIDQTFGDCSVAGAQADESDFARMLDWAREQAKANNGMVVIKTHPDVILGKKKGYFSPGMLNDDDHQIRFLVEDVCPRQLIQSANRIATVCSQMGFEALWRDGVAEPPPVHCFGVSFYAQRGLTIDHARARLNRSSLTIEQLFNGVMLEYPIYWHPEKNVQCDIEAVLDWLQAQLQVRALQAESLNVVGVSFWKRSFLPEFVSDSAKRIKFTTRPCSAPAHKGRDIEQPNVTELHWGMKTHPENDDRPVWRMEDGFVRSVGLGADLRRPCSLVVDDLGIYYNGQQASRLERLLHDVTLNEYEQRRIQRMIQSLIDSQLTKYNVEAISASDANGFKARARGREIVLVTGQFQDDLSIQYGALEINTNLKLLAQVRRSFPQAFIIYKEHPDVYSGVRPGKLSEQDVREFANEYVTDLPLTVCFEFIDRLCTICSLSGFEALLRGIPVSTFGLPFYAGWGLTSDYHSFERRRRVLNLQELAYAALVLYPRYVNWHSRTLTSAEMIIEQLIQQRHNAAPLKSHWLSRQARKVRYLREALF